jgi:hypothetical protein
MGALPALHKFSHMENSLTQRFFYADSVIFRMQMPNLADRDWVLLLASFWAFAIAFLLPLAVDAIFGLNLFTEIWIMPGVAFHEVGHLLFMLFVNPLFKAVGFWPAYANTPADYMGGFLNNCIMGVALLAFSLWMQSKLGRKEISGEYSFTVFSFMLIAYSNLFMASHTIFRLEHGHVVGEGLDFTMASFELSMTLDQLVFWASCAFWASALAAIWLNCYFWSKRQAPAEHGSLIPM